MSAEGWPEPDPNWDKERLAERRATEHLVGAERQKWRKVAHLEGFYNGRSGRIGAPPSADAPSATVSPHGEDDPYALTPTDWVTLIRDGIPEVDYLDPSYIPRGARIWIWGKTGTTKSLWAMWKAAQLSKRGIRVAYFSEENPISEDLRRLALVRPDPNCFKWFHRTTINLADPRWVAAFIATTAGYDVAVIDSWTDLWLGDEGANAEVRNFDAQVLKPLQAQGVTPVVIHHVGHPQMFSDRKGADAGRGASSLGQKADVTLEFKAEDVGIFTIVYGKTRIGGERQPNRTFQVVDVSEDEDESLDIVEIANPETRAIEALAEKMVQAILTAPRGYLTKSELRAAAGGSKARQGDAFPIVEQDRRVAIGVEKVATKDGKRRDAQVFRPSA